MTLLLPGYNEACRTVVLYLREGMTIGDAALEALLVAQTDDADRKRMISALLGARLITRDQAAMQVYLRPALRGA